MTLKSEPSDPTVASQTEQRSGPRYPSARKSLNATILGAGQESPCQATVMDLSPDGAKVTVAFPLTVQAEAIVRMQSPQARIEKRARVCWCRPARYGWWVGLDFLDPLTDRQFDELAEDGLIDRRRDERVPQSATLQAHLELADAPFSVELMDLSTGGLRIGSPVLMEMGQRVLLKAAKSKEPPVVVRVQWVKPADAAYEVGCAFIDREGRQRFARLLDQQRCGSGDLTLPHSPRRLWGLVMGVAAVAVVGLCFTTQALLGLVTQSTPGQ